MKEDVLLGKNPQGFKLQKASLASPEDAETPKRLLETVQVIDLSTCRTSALHDMGRDDEQPRGSRVVSKGEVWGSRREG